VNILDAEKDFVNLVSKVHREGITIDLEKNDQVIAQITPVLQRPKITVGELSAFMRTLPRLDGDADEFADDIKTIRKEFPAEANPWG